MLESLFNKVAGLQVCHSRNMDGQFKKADMYRPVSGKSSLGKKSLVTGQG